MIETLDNGIQLAVTGVCSGIALYNAVMSRKKIWAMFAIFFSGFFMGNLYWQLFLQFYGDSPPEFYVADLSWYVSYFFLFLILKTISAGTGHNVSPGEKPAKSIRVIEWIIILFSAGMCIYYMQWGDIISDIISALLMALIAIEAVKGLYLPKGERSGLYLLSLIFVIVEYGIWTASCFWLGDTLLNPYFWFDTGLSIILLLLLITTLKEFGGGSKTE